MTDCNHEWSYRARKLSGPYRHWLFTYMDVERTRTCRKCGHEDREQKRTRLHG